MDFPPENHASASPHDFANVIHNTDVSNYCEKFETFQRFHFKL